MLYSHKALPLIEKNQNVLSPYPLKDFCEKLDRSKNRADVIQAYIGVIYGNGLVDIEDKNYRERHLREYYDSYYGSSRPICCLKTHSELIAQSIASLSQLISLPVRLFGIQSVSKDEFERGAPNGGKGLIHNKWKNMFSYNLKNIEDVKPFHLDYMVYKAIKETILFDESMMIQEIEGDHHGREVNNHGVKHFRSADLSRISRVESIGRLVVSGEVWVDMLINGCIGVKPSTSYNDLSIGCVGYLDSRKVFSDCLRPKVYRSLPQDVAYAIEDDNHYFSSRSFGFRYANNYKGDIVQENDGSCTFILGREQDMYFDPIKTHCIYLED